MATERKAHPFDPDHAMDWSVLDLGLAPASRTAVEMVDFTVWVYGLEEIKHSTRPIAAVMMAPGFANKVADLEPMATGLLGTADRLTGRRRTHDFLVITLDQRNHGERRRFKNGVAPQRDPRDFGVVLAISLSGGVMDQQLVMTYLNSLLWPRDERAISEWMSCGFSMGGHVCWRLLREDPRVRIGVPIAAPPPERLGRSMVSAHAAGAYHLPRDILGFYDITTPAGTFADCKILRLHGELDKVIPVVSGEDRWKEIQQETPDAAMWVQKQRGHLITPEMVVHAAEWFYRWGLTAQE